MNIYEKLAKIREISDAVVKNADGYNYKYADLPSILAKVTAGMKKYRVVLIPSIIPGTTKTNELKIVKTKFSKSGEKYDQITTEMQTTGEMNFRWVNEESPDEYIDVPWFFTGSQEDVSQGFGSAISYATRYFLVSFFSIAQNDDVDAYRSKQKEAEAAEDKAIAEKIISEVDTKIRTYLADHPDKAEEVKKFATKFVKGGNYNSITNPALATKFATDFDAEFGKQ